MKFQVKLDICLWKRYFEIGYNITNYLKYLVIVFGFTTQDLKNTFIIAGVYVVVCFIVGYFWLNSDMYKAELEVTNRFNPFVKEMRASHKKRKV